MKPKTEIYDTKENLTLEEVEEYLAFYDECKPILRNANDRVKAAELKREALKTTPTTIEQTMSESQLYEMDNILWARNKTLQYLRIYVIGQQRLPKKQMDKVMAKALTNHLDVSKLNTQIVNMAMENPINKDKINIGKIEKE